MSETPVMKEASSECRKSAALATSQPVPMRRPSGTRRSRAAITSARGVPAATRDSMAIGVFMSPGRIELARTPYWALCAARFSVSATTAALVVL